MPEHPPSRHRPPPPAPAPVTPTPPSERPGRCLHLSGSERACGELDAGRGGALQECLTARAGVQRSGASGRRLRKRCNWWPLWINVDVKLHRIHGGAPIESRGRPHGGEAAASPQGLSKRRPQGGRQGTGVGAAGGAALVPPQGGIRAFHLEQPQCGTASQLSRHRGGVPEVPQPRSKSRRCASCGSLASMRAARAGSPCAVPKLSRLAPRESSHRGTAGSGPSGWPGPRGCQPPGPGGPTARATLSTGGGASLVAGRRIGASAVTPNRP